MRLKKLVKTNTFFFIKKNKKSIGIKLRKSTIIGGIKGRKKKTFLILLPSQQEIHFKKHNVYGKVLY